MKRRENKGIHNKKDKRRWKEEKIKKNIRKDKGKSWKEAKTKKYIRKDKRRENKEILKTMEGELDGKKRKQRNT